MTMNGAVTGEGEVAEMADFDLQKDVKITPIVPNGTYLGSFTKVEIMPKGFIACAITLAGNGGLLSDGSTPVDGATVVKRIFLPLTGDEDKLTSSGKQSKWQWKVNQLNEFFGRLNVKDVSSPSEIKAWVAEARWNAVPVKAEVSVGSYNGTPTNEVDKVVAI